VYLQNTLQKNSRGKFSLVSFRWPALTTFFYVHVHLVALSAVFWKMCYSFHSFLMPSRFVFCQFLLHLSSRNHAAIIFYSNAFSSRDSLAYLHNPCPYGVAQEKTGSQKWHQSQSWLALTPAHYRLLAYKSLSVNQHANEHRQADLLSCSCSST